MALRLRLSPQKERRELFQQDGPTSSPLRGDFKQLRLKPMQFSFGQALAMAALAASASAILTAMVSAHSFSLTMTGQFLDQQQPLFMSRQLRPSSPVTPPTVVSAVETQQQWEDNPTPKVVWLMSFPNSGTSFTIHMTREATNCTTATNYGLEGEIKDEPSVPAIQGEVGGKGPWLELIPGRTTRIASTILTKTHCKGFCSGSYCGPEKTFHTVRSFMMGCLTGNQGVRDENGNLKLVDATYSKDLVKKSIHIFRHPLDNVVARFHLEFNEKRDAKDKNYMQLFPKNATGFHRWCALDDRNRGLVRSRFVDRSLREHMLKIPCFNEFYRYVQWHNLAFATTQAMNVSTMILHYHEYSQDFPKARQRVLDFLELPCVGEGIDFHDGKVYRAYYSHDQRIAIRAFLEEFSTAETWQELKDYDFETNQSPNLASMDVV